MGNGGKVSVPCVGTVLAASLAWLMASRSDVDATVSYYGLGPRQITGIQTSDMPLMTHIDV